MAETETPGEEQAHDVLAAEEFPVPAADPDLHHGPVVLPDDPKGVEEPHDVLAAEEFPMPAPRPGVASPGVDSPPGVASHPGVASRPDSSCRRGLAMVALALIESWRLRRGRRPR